MGRLPVLLATLSLLVLSSCGPLPWARHKAIMAFVAAETKEANVPVYVSSDMEGTSVEKLNGDRVLLADAQKSCEEVECDWWDYKDEKRELSIMRIRGKERHKWNGYHMKFEKVNGEWVAKAEFLGGEQQK